MKFKRFFLLCVFSTGSYACPDLAGKYTCRSDLGFTHETTITQRVENGATIYSSTDDDAFDIIVDGKEHLVTHQSGITAMTKFECLSDSSIEGDFKSTETAIEMKGEIRIQKMGSNITSKTEIFMNGRSFFKDQTHCTRL